jgi:hypothetical protein
MELSPAQQERYSRHLLLDGFDQERAMQLSIAVKGRGIGARWAARYLAASGVQRLAIDEPAWRDELQKLGPWLEIVESAAIVCAPTIDTPEGGALAAAEALRK